MLRALTRLFRPRRDAEQIELAFRAPSPRTGEELLVRLHQFGLRRITRCRLTRNRNVMVSYAGAELRVHEGYLDASDPVLRAIVDFVQARTRAERREAQRIVVSHPVRSLRPRGRRERTHPDDIVVAEQLRSWHTCYNGDHFEGALRPIEIRVSRRMKSRLGHYTAAMVGGEGAEIAISRAHLRTHGWTEALQTLLHEMVHQWQDECGHTIDHGASFRRKARAVGVAPYARRVLASRPGRSDGDHMLAWRAARTD